MTDTPHAAGNAASPAPPALSGYLFGFVGVCLFGATLPMTRIALEGFTPAFITLGRACVAAIAAALVLAVLHRRLDRTKAGELFLAGVFLVFGFPGFSTVAMQTIPASHGAIVLGILPLLTAVFATLIAGERPGPAFWFWSIAGAAAVLTFTLSGADVDPGMGDLWLALAAACAAIGYVLSGRLARIMPGWEVIAWALVLTAPISFAGTMVLWSAAITDPGAPEILAFLYLGLFSMFLGFVFWNRGLAIGGIARVGQVQLLQTFVTIGVSAALLGEPLTTGIFAFACIVAFCVFMGRKARAA